MSAETNLPPVTDRQRYADLVRLTDRLFPLTIEKHLLMVYALVEATYHDWLGQPRSQWINRTQHHSSVWGLMFCHGRQRDWYFGLDHPRGSERVRLVALTSEGAWTFNRVNGKVRVNLDGLPYEPPPELAWMDEAGDDYLFSLACYVLVAVASGERINFQQQ